MPRVNIYLPDDLYQQVRNANLSMSPICQDALRDEVYHRRVLASPSDVPRTFSLQRDRDPSGVSGIGLVAHGVRWPDGGVAVRWVGARPSTVVWSTLADPIAIHGHDGATRFVWHQLECPACRASLPEPV